MLAYVIITIAFALGLHFIMKHENVECGSKDVGCRNGTFIMERKEVGLSCTANRYETFCEENQFYLSPYFIAVLCL